VKGGDIITSLENLYLSTDGTMKDYCDVLRTYKPEDTLAIQVLRWGTQEVLEGQLNGRALEVAYAFGNPEPTEPGPEEPSPTEEGSEIPVNCEVSDTAGYNRCWDDSGTIDVEIPDYWLELNSTPWTFNEEEIGVAISAAPSLSDFEDYWDAEGMFFGASDTFAQIGGYVEFLDYFNDVYEEDCTIKGRYTYNDGVYKGKYDYFTKCGGSGGYDAYVLSAVDIEDQFSKIILIEIMVPPDEVDTVNQIWGTFYVYF
jgi:serine protease Do